MSEFARVDSIDSLSELRIFLCKLADKVKVGLDEADSDIRRTGIWLKQDQHSYWTGEVRKNTELFNRAKLALKRKQDEKTPLGGRYSCVDEKKALAVAKRRLEESEQKVANVKRWILLLEKEVFSFKGLTKEINQAIDADIPHAVAKLDNMISALESYASVGVLVGEGSSTETGELVEVGSEGEQSSMAREGLPGGTVSAEVYQKLREKTPSQSVRDASFLADPSFSWPKGCKISKAQREAITALDMEGMGSDAEDKIVLAQGIWDQSRVYLERVSGVKDDSGWYVGFTDDSKVKGYEAMSIGAFLALRGDLDDILKLPPGYLVVLAGAKVEAVVDGEGAIVWPRFSA
ncbi:MAG: immunity protein Imm33 domain-containing protein [Planctomycetota bacterium]|jgi:hypothetical protein